MTSQNPESSSREAFDALCHTVDALLLGKETEVTEWSEKDPSGMRLSSNGVIRGIQCFLAPSRQHKVVSKEVDVMTQGGYEGVRIIDRTASVDGQISVCDILMTGYYAYDISSFLMGQAVWHAPLAPERLTEEEAKAISGCISGELRNVEAAETTLQRFRVYHNI